MTRVWPLITRFLSRASVWISSFLATENTRLVLARLAIEEGQAQDAVPEARECFNQLHQEQLPDDEIGADLVLADALLNLSKNADAKKELVALRPVELKTQNRDSLEITTTRSSINNLPAVSRQLFWT